MRKKSWSMVSILSNKCVSTAVLAICLAVAGCSSGRKGPADEKNFSFSMDRNLIVLEQATIDGNPARVLLATASPISLRDPGLLKNPGLLVKNPIEVRIGHRYQQSIRSEPADLAGIGELLLGFDAFPDRTVVIDFSRRLVSVLRSEPGSMTSDLRFFPFRDVPAIEIEVNGAGVRALIDTANADTVVLPVSLNKGRQGRRNVQLSVDGNDLGTVDASFSNVSSARIGNRILQHFLIRIDYRNKQVSLWKSSRGNR